MFQSKIATHFLTSSFQRSVSAHPWIILAEGWTHPPVIFLSSPLTRWKATSCLKHYCAETFYEHYRAIIITGMRTSMSNFDLHWYVWDRSCENWIVKDCIVGIDKKRQTNKILMIGNSTGATTTTPLLWPINCSRPLTGLSTLVFKNIRKICPYNSIARRDGIH